MHANNLLRDVGDDFLPFVMTTVDIVVMKRILLE